MRNDSWEDRLPLPLLVAQSRILPRSFYARPTIEVARALLGKILVYGETAGRIVEAEAYLGLDDLAAHASRGITPRTRVLFGEPGHAYVYLIYGQYDCLNLVAEPDGTPGCVLLRAVEPLAGIERMRARRPAARSVEALASGPARLTMAMGISRSLYGTDVTRGDLVVRQLRRAPRFETLATPRIGVTRCAHWPLRFVVAGSRFLSR